MNSWKTTQKWAFAVVEALMEEMVDFDHLYNLIPTSWDDLISQIEEGVQEAREAAEDESALQRWDSRTQTRAEALLQNLTLSHIQGVRETVERDLKARVEVESLQWIQEGISLGFSPQKSFEGAISELEETLCLG